MLPRTSPGATRLQEPTKVGGSYQAPRPAIIGRNPVIGCSQGCQLRRAAWPVPFVGMGTGCASVQRSRSVQGRLCTAKDLAVAPEVGKLQGRRAAVQTVKGHT